MNKKIEKIDLILMIYKLMHKEVAENYKVKDMAITEYNFNPLFRATFNAMYSSFKLYFKKEKS